MKRTFALLLALAFLVGCQLTPQTIAYRSLASLETGTVAAFDAYLTSVAKGKTSTNSVPSIAKNFQAFQDSMKAATLLAMGNSNAVAPPELSASSASLLNQISNAK